MNNVVDLNVVEYKETLEEGFNKTIRVETKSVNGEERSSEIVDVIRFQDWFKRSFKMFGGNDLPFIYTYNRETGVWKAKDKKGIQLWQVIYNLVIKSIDTTPYNVKTLTSLKTACKWVADELIADEDGQDILRVVSPSKVLFEGGVFDYSQELGENDLTLKPVDDSTYKEHFFHKVPVKLPNTYDERQFAENEYSIIDKYVEYLLGDDKKTYMQIIGNMFYRDYHLQYFAFWTHFDLKNEASNGKSHLANLMMVLLGDNLEKPTLTSSVQLDAMTGVINDTFQLATIEHKYLNVERELPETHIKQAKFLKNATGNEPVSIANKYETMRDYKNYAKFQFLGNKLPSLSQRDKGLERRTIFLVFDKTVTSTTPEILEFNKHTEIWKDKELQGRFVWRCIQEYLNMTSVPNGKGDSRDFYQSEKAKHLKDKWLGGSTPLNAIISELVTYTGNKSDYVFKEDLYTDIKDALNADGQKPVSWKSVKETIERQTLLEFNFNDKPKHPLHNKQMPVMRGLKYKVDKYNQNEIEDSPF